ncbi:MAG: methyltransferase domain-containing protein [Magnetococcales bacterium]|nr:methyltransferase domain-containing protein [Magnetococcales bacterium]
MDVAQLMEMARGFQKAQTLLTAHRLGVFRVLGDERLTADEVAVRLACAVRGVTILLDALVALELLAKESTFYHNTPFARQHLAPDGEACRGVSLDHLHDLMTVWSRLDEAVRTGCSVRQPEEQLMAGSAQRNAVFIGAMAEIGRPNARILAEQLDLSRYRSLVDLGGGPGVYCEEILRLNPRMHAVVADLPLTVATAQPMVAKGPFAERIGFQCVELFQGSGALLDRPYDVALLSNVLHMEGIEPNRRLLNRLHAAVNPGGMVIIHESIIDPDRTAPPDRALFAINMLVNTERGNCYTFEEMGDWLQAAGFVDVRLVDCFAQPSLMTARKMEGVLP